MGGDGSCRSLGEHMSIPVDNNDLKSLELSVDVVLVPGRSRIRIPDRRRHFLTHTSQWTFPTCLRGPKEELPIKPRPLQEVHQRKTLVMGPAFPNENRNPNKWETQKKYSTFLICISVCKNNVIYFNNLRGRGVYPELAYFM